MKNFYKLEQCLLTLLEQERAVVLKLNEKLIYAETDKWNDYLRSDAEALKAELKAIRKKIKKSLRSF